MTSAGDVDPVVQKDMVGRRNGAEEREWREKRKGIKEG